MVDHAAKLRANVVSVRIGGKDQYIVLNERNEKAVRLAMAMKNMDAMELDRFTGGAAWITCWFASVNTQYNPVFGVMNLARDLQGAMLQLSTTPLAGKQAEVFRNSRRNTRSIYKDLRRERREESAGTSEWAKLWEHLQLGGGTTRYRDLHADPKDCAKALQRALDQVGARWLATAAHCWPGCRASMRPWKPQRAWRLQGCAGPGHRRQEVASIAKNITVNFNRKGRNMPLTGAHFALLNAAIQGDKRMLETLTGPAGRKVMMGGMALGMVSAMAGYLMMAEANGRVERGQDADAVLLAQLRGSAGLLDKHISELMKMRRRIQASEPPNKRELLKEVNAEIEASMHRLNQATEVLGQARR
ncbi:hypothetical protein CLV01_3479 [Delftia sp. 60]|uniref:hypothetical protein n=1 Tax=Delftia sp. 60 TaxID=2035216 RepID=UPI000C569464|nr:hypothetical protein [Delftia sp. 60]PIF37746.1 hypothetical protein CLU98_2970 [Burkholderiales bacterium 23]PIF67073.1 hypothetical protein CLV01_3479 [Delftia sp. 60]